MLEFHGGSRISIIIVAIGMPFGRSNIIVDVIAIICSIAVLLLAFDAFKDLG